MPMFESTAISYAKGAKRLLGEDADYLNDNPDMVPQFVNALFQSIELSLKEFGIRSGLITREETMGGRRGLIGNGHDIEKLGLLLKDRLGVMRPHSVVRLLLTRVEGQQYASQILHSMVFGAEFRPTRESYRTRKLVYHAELEEGGIQVFGGVRPWVDAVQVVAENIDNAVARYEQWKSSGAGQTYEEWSIRNDSYLIS